MKMIFCIGDMSQGGAQRVVVNLCNYFIGRGNEVDIIATKNTPVFYELNKKINYIVLDKNNKPGNLITRTFKRINKLHHLLKSEKPDIVVSFLPEPTFRVLISNFFLKKKLIISVRNDPNVLYNSFIKKMLLKFLYVRADGFVFQTIDAQKWFPRKIQNKSVVISNPINEDFICKPYNGKRDKVIVNVARIASQKRHDLLIDAFYEVHKKHPDYILKIFGDGSTIELDKKVSQLNLCDCVFFMGNVKQLKDEIYKSSIFVLSSDYEGMPNALMEAMALGLPCVSTDCPCGGPRYLIKNKENGLLVKVGNKSEIVDSINYLIENPDEANRMGKEANRICNRLNPKVINKEWEKYIESIL